MNAVSSAPGHAVSMPSGKARRPAVRRRFGRDDAQGDRLVTASVGLVSAVIGTVTALCANGTTAAVFVGLVTLCVTPGCALACWLPTKDRLTRVVTVIAASLTWTILITSVLAWRQVTALGALLIATAGIGGIVCAAFLIAQLVKYMKRMPESIPVEENKNPSEEPTIILGVIPAEDPTIILDAIPRSSADSPRSFALVGFLTALTAAAELLAIAIIQARRHVVGSYGLLPVLGVSFLAAAVLTVGVLVFALRFIRTAWPAAVFALGLLLVEFNGTSAMLAATPLSSWTYKHFGVVEYVVHGGALNDPLDIYQQWPGFFAAAAGLVRLSGRGPLSYSNWAELFFAALNALVLFAIARRLYPDHRVVPYIAVLIFETATWEGQIYYSPQTTAFLLALLFQFFLLPLLEPARLRRPFLYRNWLSVSPLDTPGQEWIDTAGMAARMVGLVALFVALTITHQLSPYVVFAGVVGLWALGILRHPLLVLTLTIIVVIYPLLHLAAVGQNDLLNGFSFNNATGTQGLTSPTQQQAVAGVISKTIGLGLWGASAFCVLSGWRRLGTSIIPAVLAGVPFFFLGLTSYAGEAIYRVFLFSSPWCALIIARRLATLARIPTLRWTAVGLWALFAALGSAQSQDFGMYPMLQVPPSEITASAYFLDHAPPQPTLVLAAPNLPSRPNGRYVLHNKIQTQNDPSLGESPQYEKNGLDRANPKELAQSVTYLAKGTGFLVVAPSMDTYAAYYGVFTPGTLSALVPRLEASPYWQVWYRNDGSVILRAWPQGRSAK